jgi:hypothetical protein
MPTATALRSFDHNGKYKKGDTVIFDAITIKALQRSGLVSKETGEDPKSEVVTGEAPQKKPGKKSAASQAAPALPQLTAPPLPPGALPPPPPVK